jgi:hypothetical protein
MDLGTLTMKFLGRKAVVVCRPAVKQWHGVRHHGVETMLYPPSTNAQTHMVTSLAGVCKRRGDAVWGRVAYASTQATSKCGFGSEWHHGGGTTTTTPSDRESVGEMVIANSFSSSDLSLQKDRNTAASLLFSAGLPSRMRADQLLEASKTQA